MTNPLARAPEPPEKVLARALRTLFVATGSGIVGAGYPEAIIQALADEGYRIVPESPAPHVHAFLRTLGWKCACGMTRGEYAEARKGAVPELEVGLDALTQAIIEVSDENSLSIYKTTMTGTSWFDRRRFAVLLAARLSSRRSEGPGR